MISIHPLLAERDVIRPIKFVYQANFNPPAPRGAGPVTSRYAPIAFVFQSTRSSRSGTEKV